MENKIINRLDNNNDLIYKYVPLSINTLKMLILGKLWFGFPHALNDPFEGEFVLGDKQLPKDEELKKFYLKNNLSSEQLFPDKLRKIKNNPDIFFKEVSKFVVEYIKESYGVSCFSKKYNSIKMWSHYADSHKGLCLAFKREELQNSLLFCSYEKVIYREKLATIYLRLNGGKINVRGENEFMYRKLKDWEDEREVRFIRKFSKNDNRLISFHKSCLDRVILGSNIDPQDHTSIVRLLKNDPEYSVKWYKASKNLEKRVIEIVPIQHIKLSV